MSCRVPVPLPLLMLLIQLLLSRVGRASLVFAPESGTVSTLQHLAERTACFAALPSWHVVLVGVAAKPQRTLPILHANKHQNTNALCGTLWTPNNSKVHKSNS